MSDFTQEITPYTTESKVHADVFNVVVKYLLDNTKYNKETIEAVAKELTYKIDNLDVLTREETIRLMEKGLKGDKGDKGDPGTTLWGDMTDEVKKDLSDHAYAFFAEDLAQIKKSYSDDKELLAQNVTAMGVPADAETEEFKVIANKVLDIQSGVAVNYGAEKPLNAPCDLIKGDVVSKVVEIKESLNLSTLACGSTISSILYSPSGEYIIIGISGAPCVYIYRITLDGDTSLLCTGDSLGILFAPNHVSFTTDEQYFILSNISTGTIEQKYQKLFKINGSEVVLCTDFYTKISYGEIVFLGNINDLVAIGDYYMSYGLIDDTYTISTKSYLSARGEGVENQKMYKYNDKTYYVFTPYSYEKKIYTYVVTLDDDGKINNVTAKYNSCIYDSSDSGSYNDVLYHKDNIFISKYRSKIICQVVKEDGSIKYSEYNLYKVNYTHCARRGDYFYIYGKGTTDKKDVAVCCKLTGDEFDFATAYKSIFDNGITYTEEQEKCPSDITIDVKRASGINLLSQKYCVNGQLIDFPYDIENVITSKMIFDYNAATKEESKIYPLVTKYIKGYTEENAICHYHMSKSANKDEWVNERTFTVK